VRESEKEGKKGPAMLLTATWSSCGTCSMAEGGEVALCWAAKVRRRWRQRLLVRLGFQGQGPAAG
jgi:hypothetical protein